MRRFDRACALTAALVFPLLVTPVGCGYRSQLSSAPESPPREDSDLESKGSRQSQSARIAVLALRNDSPEPWLDRILADAMRREIGARSALEFVNDPDRADLVVRGRIRPLNLRSESFSQFVSAVEYGLTLQLDLEVVLASGNVVRLDSRMLSESDVFLASPDIEVTRTNRLEVLRRLSDVLASRLADSIELLERPIPVSALGQGG